MISSFQTHLEKLKSFAVTDVDDRVNKLYFLEVIEKPGIDSFLIAINPQSIKSIGLTLAHALVHVKQFISGKLKTLDNGDQVWCGKTYGKDCKYMDQPWKLQAFARQEIIFRRCISEE
jgi:hypothetical protein